MQDYFRIRVGGSGNITSVAWEDGDLTPTEIASRNSTVDAENPNTIKPKLLGVFQSVDELDEWATALNNEFVSKGRKMDDSLSDAIGEALQMLMNGAGIVFIDAMARMCNASLIHLTGIKSDDPKSPPQINEGVDVDYDNESHKLLLSNGGTISADVDQGESECVFYHPPAWIYRAYMIQDTPFVGWFEYTNATYGFSNATLQSEILPNYENQFLSLVTFAWFGTSNENFKSNTGIPSNYFKNVLGWQQERKYDNGESGPLCWLGDKESTKYTWGNLTSNSFSSYTKESAFTTFPMFLFSGVSFSPSWEQLAIPSYTPAENTMFSPSQWSEVWYSAVYAFWWNYDNAHNRGGFVVKTPFYRDAYNELFHESGIEPSIGDVINWIPNILWDSENASDFYDSLFTKYGEKKVGEYATTQSGNKVGGFVCIASNSSNDPYHTTSNMLDFANGDTASYPVGKFVGQSDGTTMWYTSEVYTPNQQPASAVTVEQHTSSIQLKHTISFDFRAMNIVANVTAYGRISPYWNIFTDEQKYNAIVNTLPLEIYFTGNRLETIEVYGNDPSNSTLVQIVNGVVRMPMIDVLRLYGIDLTVDNTHLVQSLFANGSIPLNFLVNNTNSSAIHEIHSFAVGGELMGDIINEWKD